MKALKDFQNSSSDSTVHPAADRWSGSTIYGNIAATVVLQVDRTNPYAPDPGHPGFGTIAAVIEDAAHVFNPPSLATIAKAEPRLTAAASAGPKRYSIYSPEMSLLSETELTNAPHPTILYDYIWFDGRPIAQIDSTGLSTWTFTDHLGTPLLQTSAFQGITWRAEYEPYGLVYALRTYDRHQPLRLPGQEAEQLGAGANGVTERFYNVHRWYEAGVGRYGQADPLGLEGIALGSYAYAVSNPLNWVDPLGLTEFRGFEADEEEEMRRGVDQVRQRLTGCCAGNLGEGLLEKLEKAIFVADRSLDMSVCGVTTFGGFLTNTIRINTVVLLDPGLSQECCAPGGLIVYELQHLRVWARIGPPLERFQLKKQNSGALAAPTQYECKITWVSGRTT